MSDYLYVIAVSLLVTYLLTPVIRKLAIKHGVLDQPDKRKVHKEPVPRWGGIAIYLGFMVSAIVALFLYHKTYGLNSKDIMELKGLFIGSTGILLLGIIDDRYQLSAKVKLIGQIIIAVITIAFGVKIEFLSTPFDGLYYLTNWISIGFTIFWIVGITNAINLLDGLDGLLAGVASIASLMLALVAFGKGQFLESFLLIALLGSTLAFLKFNFNPAKIFMGDAGSLFLGYVLATVSIMGALKMTTAITFLVPILILGLPIFDTSFAIIRRLRNGKPIFQADKGHVHHRLLDLGLNQKQAVYVIYLASSCLGIIALVLSYGIR